MATKTKKEATYKELITMSDSQIEAEQVDFSVERGKNTLEKGLLDVKGQAIDKESAVKSAELKVSDADKNIEKAKRSVPLDPNNLVKAYQAKKQAILDFEAAKEDYDNVKDVLTFLQTVEKQLFPTT
jgi:hypothetical protein